MGLRPVEQFEPAAMVPAAGLPAQQLPEDGEVGADHGTATSATWKLA
jgi:hypothetical protein